MLELLNSEGNDVFFPGSDEELWVSEESDEDEEVDQPRLVS